MADHDDGAAALGHLADGLHDGHALAVVEAARGLVEQDHVRVGDDDARERHHLALPAREGEGRLIEGQPEAQGNLLGAPLRLLRLDALELKAEGDLLEDRVLAELAVGVLEEGRAAGGDGARRHLARVEASDADTAGRGLEQAVQQLGERGLAGAVLTHDAHELAGIDAHLEVAHGGAAMRIGEVHALEQDDGLGSLGVGARGGGVRGRGGACPQHHAGRGPSAGRGTLADAHEPGNEGLGLSHVQAGLARRDETVPDKAVRDAGDARAVDANLAKLGRVTEHLVRRAGEGDVAAVHDDDAAAVLGEQGDLLLDDDDGHAQAFVRLAQRLEDEA